MKIQLFLREESTQVIAKFSDIGSWDSSMSAASSCGCIFQDPSATIEDNEFVALSFIQSEIKDK